MTARTRPLMVAIILTLLAGLLATASASSTADAADFEQATAVPTPVLGVGGDTAVDRAIALSESSFTASASAVIARVDEYADALAAGPLAASLGGPILYVETDAAPQAVLDELTRLGVTDLVIAGGVAAVSQATEDALVAATGATARRLAGSNRYGTALAIAAELVGDGAPELVFFAEGENADPVRGWPDALSASPLAGAMGAPILPVNAAFVPQEILDAWTAWPEAQGVIVGGVAAVSEEVESILSSGSQPVMMGEEEGRELMRLAGETRFGTSAAVYEHSVSEAAGDPSTVYVVPGGNFTDGLAAGAVAGAMNHPMLLSEGTEPVENEVSAVIRGAGSTIQQFVAVGDAGGEIAGHGVVNVEAAFCLRLLHNNDAESQLFGTGPGNLYGGLARFVTLAQQQQADTFADTCASSGVVTVTSGDNFLAGPELSASQALPEDQPVYDVLGYERVGYDALAIGNHEFDFGPDFLERFISSFSDPAPPFLSANLSFENEAGLQALVDAGRIAPMTTVETDGGPVAIIGLTTPSLDSISSPRNTTIDTDVLAAVQTQVAMAEAAGTEVIILISHLQGVEEDLALIADLSGVDVVVAGGGDEVLADPGTPLVPGDLGAVFGAYPLEATDADGDLVPVVTTAGDLKYQGRLELHFDDSGELIEGQEYDDFSSRMVRVADESIPYGVAADADTSADIQPVQDYVDGLAMEVIGSSEVGLDGSRPNIRQQETNLGNLMADSLRSTAESLAADFGLDDTQPFVGLQNGGGIRNNNVIPAGDITTLTTFEIAPFANFVGAIPDVSPAQLKSVLERGYAAVEFAGGNFAHISNLVVEVDLNEQAQEIDEDDAIVTEGSRVRSVTLEDGTEIITDGEVAMGAPDVTLVTIDFLARGGDSYPLGELDFSVLGVSYQQALANFIADSLGGTIAAADYPEGGEGRITITPADGGM